MPLKVDTDSTLRFDAAPISWRRHFMLFVPLACYLAIFFYPTSRSKDFLSADLPVLVIFCVTFIGVLWYGKRNPKKRYLVVTDTGLMQVYGSTEFSYPWREIKLVQVNKNRQDRVISLSILMQSGELWNVSGYTDMDVLTKQVAKYTKAGRLDGIFGSIRTRPWIRILISHILTLLVLLGWKLFPKQVPIELVLIPLMGFMTWLYPTKTGSDITKRLFKHYLIFFLFIFGLSVIIFVLLHAFAK